MAKKVKRIETEFHCRDCKHSYDWHEKSVTGEVFMCRCPFNKWSKFLSDPQCDKFQKRTN